MTDLIVREYQGIQVYFQSDAYLNATLIAKHFSKRPQHYLDSDRTREYLDAIFKKLKAQNPAFEKNQLVIIRQGAPEAGGGTWLHPKLSMDYARWLDANFAVWCDEEIEFILKSNQPLPAQQNLRPISFVQVDRDFRAIARMGRAAGLDDNQARFAANRAIKNFMGVDCMGILGVTHLIASEQDVLLTATEVGQRLDISVKKINPVLESFGLVKGYRDHRDRQQWELTDDGQQYGCYLDTGKKHSDGTPVRQIKWNSNVVDFLKAKEATA